MTTAETLIENIKKALAKSSGASVVEEATDKLGRNVRVVAFIAGGNVNPGSFRSNWFIDGVKFSKAKAVIELGRN